MFSTIEELEKLGYKLHHSAYHRGYQKKGSLSIEEYNGRYGKGFKVSAHNPRSSQFKIVHYLIKK